MTNHLNRQELIAAAGMEPEARDQHLKTCSECRELVELLHAFPVWGKARLPEAPESWIVRAQAVAAGRGIKGRIRETLARLVFDSWALPEPVGVREEGTIEHRRVRFESEQGQLDVRGERLPDGWLFVAQWTGEKERPDDLVIQAGRTALRPDEFGMVQWKGRRPPATLKIRTGAYVVRTPELSWKAPRRN